MRRCLWILACASAASTAFAAPASSPKKSAFETVIKQPTGRNGYEELVLAADQLQGCPAWKEIDANPGATLAQMRALLSDRQVAQVLRLLQQGLAKPVGAPREQSTFDTVTPELGEFRALGRLLAMQQYVFFADDRLTDALGNARFGLRLGQAVQTDSMLSGVVGVSIGASCIQPLGAHLDQLGARDAETLFALCREWLRQPSREVRLMEMERRSAVSSLQALRGETPERLIAATNMDPKPKPDDDDGIRAGRVLAADLRRLGNGPGAIDQICGDAGQRLDTYYGAVLAQFALPLWQRRVPPVPQDGSLAGRLAAQLFPTVTGVGTAYARDQARMRMLACHAAILRYRWEHKKPPATLAELNLGDLATDPFTGASLEYQALGTRYRLVSAGPEATGDNPLAVNGRIPVTVTPND